MLKKIKIKNFRSIEYIEIELGALNAFIGQNNSGKSNIMSALNIVLGERWPKNVLQSDDFFNYNKGKMIEIDIMFDKFLEYDNSIYGFKYTFDGEEDTFQCLDEYGHTFAPPKFVKTPMRNEVALMYLGLDRNAKEQINASQWKTYGKLLKYIEKSIDEETKKKFQYNLHADYVSHIEPNVISVLNSINSYVLEQTNLKLDFKFESVDPNYILKNLRLYLREGSLLVDPENVGAGIQSAVSIAIARAYAELVRHPLILVIEEPELYQHPHACRAFYTILRKISNEGIQVLYTTHDRCFVNLLDYHDIYLVSKKDKKTEVIEGNKLFLTPDNEMKILSKCDESLNEVFFANKVVVAEGIGDKLACQMALEQMDFDINKNNISIIDMNGKDSISFILQMLHHFKIESSVLMDDDDFKIETKEAIDKCRAIVGEDNLFLQHTCLEDLFNFTGKIDKEKALKFLPKWFDENKIPQIYLKLKDYLIKQ